MGASILHVASAERELPGDAASARMTIEELFATYVSFVWRRLRDFGVAEADLDDQTQEVFVVVHRRIHEWDGHHPRAWLHAIARRCAAGYRRQTHRRHESAVETMPEARDTRDPSARAEVDLLSRVLDSLDEDQRTVFLLFAVEEMPMREVAEAMQCSLQSAYRRLSAARRALSRALEEST